MYAISWPCRGLGLVAIDMAEMLSAYSWMWWTSGCSYVKEIDFDSLVTSPASSASSAEPPRPSFQWKTSLWLRKALKWEVGWRDGGMQFAGPYRLFWGWFLHIHFHLVSIYSHAWWLAEVVVVLNWLWSFAASFTNLSAFSFPLILVWPGDQEIERWWCGKESSHLRAFW